MRLLYSARSGEDRKARLIKESTPRKKAMLEAVRSSRKTPKDAPPPPAFTFQTEEDFLDFLALDEAEKWIQKAIKRPGRCKDFGGPDCPPGSPQYNLAKRFKKGGDLHKG